MSDPYLYPAADFSEPHPDDAAFVSALVAGLAHAGVRLAEIAPAGESTFPLVSVADNGQRGSAA